MFGAILTFIIALLATALVLWIVSRFNLGLSVDSFTSAIIAGVVIGRSLPSSTGCSGSGHQPGRMGGLYRLDHQYRHRGAGTDVRRSIPAGPQGQRFHGSNHRCHRHRCCRGPGQLVLGPVRHRRHRRPAGCYGSEAVSLTQSSLLPVPLDASTKGPANVRRPFCFSGSFPVMTFVMVCGPDARYT